MKIEHEPNFISNKVECFKISYATLEQFEKISRDFAVLDAWLVESSKESFDSQVGEFDFYIILDSKNSMVFKLAYCSDK